jgi:hypothetical protein
VPVWPRRQAESGWQSRNALANVLFRERDGIAFNRHYDGDGAIIFKQACALGCEGIVSKRFTAGAAGFLILSQSLTCLIDTAVPA